MSLRAFPKETHLNEKISQLISYSLVALMMTCGAMAIVSLISRVFSDWDPWYLIVLCFGASLEMLYSHRRFKSMTVFSAEWTIGMVANLITIIVVVRLVVALSHGIGAFLAEVVLWLRDGAYLLTYEFLIALSLVLVTWMVSDLFADLLDELSLRQAIIDQDSAGGDRGMVTPVRERLLRLIFFVGCVLVIVTALNRFNLRAFISGLDEPYLANLSPIDGGGAATLLYFVFALILLSQTQFLSLHTSWNMQHIPVNSKLAWRWALYSAFFLVLMVSVVSLLPTSYALGFLSVLGAILSVIGQTFLYLVQVLILLISYLIGLVFNLFGQESPGQAPMPEIPQLPEQAAAQGGMGGWWELIQSMLFWMVLIGMVGFAVVQYLRQHEELLQALRRFPGFRSLTKLLEWLRSLFLGMKRGIARAVQAGQDRIRARLAASRGLFENGYLSLRRLDARQRVYFFYLALVRRGNESGLTRGLSQTPYEYAGTLDAALPDVDEDVDAMTQAFIEARYSRRPVDSGFAGRVQEYWNHIRKALRRPEIKKLDQK